MATLRIAGITAGPPATPSAKLRVGGVSASGTPVAPSTKFRVSGVGAFGTAVPAKLRLGGVTASGPLASRAKFRVGGVTASGSGSIQLASIAERTVDPFDNIMTTVALLSGGPAVSYTWRQVSGPTVSLLGFGPTRTFVAPARMNPSTVILGVTATDQAGNVSPEQLITTQVQPHTIWYNRDNSGFTAAPLTLLGTAPSTPAPSTGIPSGVQQSDGYNWTPSTLQDFTTDAPLGGVRTAYPSMSFYNVGSNDTSGLGKYDDARTLSVHDSCLEIYQHTENGQPYGAVILPDSYAPHLYGRFDMRFKVTQAGAGYKLVPLFWPTSDDWNDGEIDWPEANLGNQPRPASAIPGTFANGGMQFLPGYDAFAPTPMTDDFHISSTRWTPKGIYFYWDNVLVLALTDPTKNPTKSMRVTLQWETWINTPPIAVPAASVGRTLIDWVAIYNLGSAL